MKRGAVLVPILAGDPDAVLFVERAQHLRRNPGQIGLPGGSEEPADGGDAVRTALRELFEELGVSADRVSIVGRLPDLEQVSGSIAIAPVVGVIDAATRFEADGDEVVGAFAVPLTSIVADGAVHEDDAQSRARGRLMYAFDYGDRHIWGFTARILKALVDAWKAPESALRAAIEAALPRTRHGGS